MTYLCKKVDMEARRLPHSNVAFVQVVSHSQDQLKETKEGNVLFNSTHFIYGYMVKDHSDSERGNLLPQNMGYSF